MAKKVKDSGHVPDLIISSPAIRALHTAVIFARALDIFEEKFIIVEDLFGADAPEIIGILKTVPDSVDSIMIFGHNPGSTNIVNFLSKIKLDNLPTSGTAKLLFNISSWEEISRNYLIDGSVDFPSANRNGIFDKS
jgi:phosphohistidine phosphatase